MNVQYTQWKMDSPIVPLSLVASDLGLISVQWCPEPSVALKSSNERGPGERILRQAVIQLEEYFQGLRCSFELPIDCVNRMGTEFQRAVWSALTHIPYGQTISYGEIAEKIQNPKAVRAVGNANGKNPLHVIVPCHRVIAARGALGGYSAGTQIKTQLLTLERKYSDRQKGLKQANRVGLS